MAWARLARTWASSMASVGVTAPLETQLWPSPMPTPRTRASWYSRQALKSMSSAPSCRRTRRAGCLSRPVAASSFARFRAGWGGTGHCPSRLVLSAPSATAPLIESWSPVRWQLVARTDMVSPKSEATMLG